MQQEVLKKGLDYQPDYDISEEEAHALCSEFLASQEHKPSEKFGCYILQGTDRFSDLARFVESTVFYDTFQNTPEVMAKEYGPYEPASRFYLVIDQEAKIPVGVMRAIENSSAGLKSLNDLEKTPLGITKEQIYDRFHIDPEKCIDVGTLAVLPEYRGRKANYIPTLLLYRTLYVDALADPRFDHAITIIDERAERGLRTLKLPFKPIDERSFSYLDSPKSRVLYGVTKDFFPTVIYWQHKYAHEAITNDDGVKHMLAAMLDALASGKNIDQMLAHTRRFPDKQ